MTGMPLNIELDQLRQIIIVDLEAASSLKDIRQADEALLKFLAARGNLDALYDCSRADFSRFYSDKLVEHAQWLTPRLDRFPRHIALVATGDLEFGVCRMWEIHAEKLAPRSRRVFRDREDAQAWLLSCRTQNQD